MTVDEKIKQYMERAANLITIGDYNFEMKDIITWNKDLQRNVIEVAKMIQKEEHRIKDHITIQKVVKK